jgi:hypothetical protein
MSIVCRWFGHWWYHKWDDEDWSCRLCGKFQEGNYN